HDAVDGRLRDLGERARPRVLRDVEHLELDRGAQLCGQLRRDGAAEALVRTLDAALLLARELVRAREVDLAHAPGPARLRPRVLLERLALARARDELFDLVLGQNLGHAAALASSLAV